LFNYGTVPKQHRTLILACMLFWSVLSYFAIRTFVLEGSEVEGHSMEPTLKQGDHFILSHISYRFRNPRRGDIVALHTPDVSFMSVKRIIALPGESVAIRNGTVFVNGCLLQEPYLDPMMHTDPFKLAGHEYEVAPNCYFVLGDNRTGSLDSRQFGAVRRSQLEGVLLLWEREHPRRVAKTPLTTGS
jgi:signal peptidase I